MDVAAPQEATAKSGGCDATLGATSPSRPITLEFPQGSIMNTRSPANGVAMSTDALEAFLALSEIYFTSTEQLTALAVATARGAVEDCVAATRAAIIAGDGRQFGVAPPTLAQPMVERMLASSRATYEIVTQAQAQAAQVLASRLSPAGTRFTVPADWNAAYDMFTRGIRELSAMNAANVAAATDAGSKFAAASKSAGGKTT